MKVTVYPSLLNGVVQAPASKSSMQRACAAALIAKGKTMISNPGNSNDDKAAIDIIERLGASCEQTKGVLVVNSNGVKPVQKEINCGESGLSIRMFTPIAALSQKPITITGNGSLLQRPMHFFDSVLPALGIKVSSNNGQLPIEIEGPLQPATIEVDGSLSSQFLTGLLMAYCACGASGVSIKVKDLKSKPYIDLTLDVMRQFGLALPINNNYESFDFNEHSVFENEERFYTVEGDWSGGAFLLVAGAIAGAITIRGLDPSSTQADRAILDALQKANAGVAIEGKEIKIHQSSLHAFEFDATDCPDLFPPLVALAAYCDGISAIRGVTRLAHKESNRAITLQDEFDKMGVRIDLRGDLMLVHGGGMVKGADVHSHHDHRIAMACAVAALRASDEMVIEEAGAINKSYPSFFNDLQSLGATVKTEYLFNPSILTSE